MERSYDFKPSHSLARDFEFRLSTISPSRHLECFEAIIVAPDRNIYDSFLFDEELYFNLKNI